MSRRNAGRKSRSQRLSPATTCIMRSPSISLKRHSQTNQSGPQKNMHAHRLVPSTTSCTGYIRHRLPPAARSAPASAPAHTSPPLPHLRSTLCFRETSPVHPPCHTPYKPAAAVSKRSAASLSLGIVIPAIVAVTHHRPPLPPLWPLATQGPDLTALPSQVRQRPLYPPHLFSPIL